MEDPKKSSSSSSKNTENDAILELLKKQEKKVSASDPRRDEYKRIREILTKIRHPQPNRYTEIIHRTKHAYVVCLDLAKAITKKFHPDYIRSRTFRQDCLKRKLAGTAADKCSNINCIRRFRLRQICYENIKPGPLSHKQKLLKKHQKSTEPISKLTLTLSKGNEWTSKLTDKSIENYRSNDKKAKDVLFEIKQQIKALRNQPEIVDTNVRKVDPLYRVETSTDDCLNQISTELDNIRNDMSLLASQRYSTPDNVELRLAELNCENLDSTLEIDDEDSLVIDESYNSVESDKHPLNIGLESSPESTNYSPPKIKLTDPRLQPRKNESIQQIIKPLQQLETQQSYDDYSIKSTNQNINKPSLEIRIPIETLMTQSTNQQREINVPKKLVTTPVDQHSKPISGTVKPFQETNVESNQRNKRKDESFQHSFPQRESTKPIYASVEPFQRSSQPESKIAGNLDSTPTVIKESSDDLIIDLTDCDEPEVKKEIPDIPPEKLCILNNLRKEFIMTLIYQASYNERIKYSKSIVYEDCQRQQYISRMAKLIHNKLIAVIPCMFVDGVIEYFTQIINDLHSKDQFSTTEVIYIYHQLIQSVPTLRQEYLRNEQITNGVTTPVNEITVKNEVIDLDDSIESPDNVPEIDQPVPIFANLEQKLFEEYKKRTGNDPNTNPNWLQEMNVNPERFESFIFNSMHDVNPLNQMGFPNGGVEMRTPDTTTETPSGKIHFYPQYPPAPNFQSGPPAPPLRYGMQQPPVIPMNYEQPRYMVQHQYQSQPMPDNQGFYQVDQSEDYVRHMLRQRLRDYNELAQQKFIPGRNQQRM